MEIINENFEDTFEFVKSAIDNCSFLSIDAEFTGLEDAKSKEIHQFDTPEERYFKLIKAAKKYIIIQFGLCTFKYFPESDCYKYHAFNFYIFPRQFIDGVDVKFLCQSSSLEYLSKHNFDFGKVIRNGISYMLPREECKMLEKYSSPDFFLFNNKPVTILPIDIPILHRPFVQRMINKTEELINSKIYGSINLDACDSYVRKILYDHLLYKFGNKVLLETKTSELNQRYIVVTFTDDLTKLRHDLGQQKRRNALADLNKAVGFSKLIKIIQDSKKLMVGHNMLLDLMHIIQQFSEPLPHDYKEFKSLVHVLFPRIMDTKFIAISPELKDLVVNFNLKDLYESILKSNKIKAVNIEPATNMKDYKNVDCFHDAGYDAYVTGICFLHMATYLEQGNKLNFSSFQTLAVLENKIYFMKSIDITFINLERPDNLPVRDQVFYIQFLKDKKTEVKDLFTPFGNVQLKFLTDESALISFYNKENAIKARSLMIIRNSWFKVVTYDDYKIQKQKFNCQIKKSNTNGTTSEPQSVKTNKEKSISKVVLTKTPASNESSIEENHVDIQMPKKKRKTEIFDVPDWNL